MPPKGELTRQKILDAASQVFWRQGFSATSINDLLAATGVTKGSLYFHFPGKDEIGLAVLRQERERFLAFVDASLSGSSPGAALDSFFSAALTQHRDNRFVGGCLFGNTALEASDTAPVFAELVAGVFADWQQRLQGWIARAQEGGEIRPDLPAGQLAEFTVSALEGAIMQARLTKQEGPLARCMTTLRTLLNLKPSVQRSFQ